MTQRLSYAEAVIANGAALQTGEIDLRNHELLAIEMPAAWTAAAITMQGCMLNDGSVSATALTETFVDVFDSGGTEVSLTAAQAHFVVLTEAHKNLMRGLARVKLRSGTTGVPVNQGGARRLRCILGQQLG